MNTHRLLIAFMLVTFLLLSSCQPAPQSESTPIAVAAMPTAPAYSPKPAATHQTIEDSVVPPADNYFQYYGINHFVETSIDHLSTFAVDVDTASYTVARRHINDGMLPPVDAVRVEEFINYFDLHYPTPEGVAFGIWADGAPSPFHADDTYILRFGIQGHRVAEEDRKPASITFVIDISGSMDLENRLGLVKYSLQQLVNKLRPDDTISIVVYGSTAYPILYPTSGAEKNLILDAIYALRPAGSTNAEAGLKIGYQMASQSFKLNGINRVILCSDGVANVGNTSPTRILKDVKRYSRDGITLTTFGFGMGNFNDTFMEQLADNGDGNYAYIDDAEEAQEYFVDGLTEILQVIAYDAKVQVDFNPDVVARYRLVGYENRDIADEDFREDSVDAGEINAGHSVTAIYAVQFKQDAEGRIATVQLRWRDPDSDRSREINGNFNTWNLAQTFEESDPHFKLATIVTFFGEVLRDSPYTGYATLEGLVPYAYRVSGDIPYDPEVVELGALIQRASSISR